MVIVDQFGRPYDSRKQPERSSLAAAPIRDAWREYVTSGLTPQRLAAIFQEADQGDVRRQAELFEQIEEKDGHLTGERSKRINAILNVDFAVSPASEDARDVRVAEFVEDYFANCTDWADVQVAMQDAVGKGYAGLEIHWDVSCGQAVPSGFGFVEQKRFLFQDRSGLLSKEPLLVTDNEPMGIKIPAWKMLLHRYGGLSGSATRAGLYRVCAWMYLFKNYALKDWSIFCEVYGMPLRLGKYAPGATESDKDALIQAISTLGSDAAGIISKSTEIEFIQTIKGTANGDLYKVLASFANAEISKALLGQTLSAEIGERGSYAASETHNEIRLDLLQADARAQAATVRTQLIRPLVGFNFGWDTPCPKYKAYLDDAGDLEVQAKWVSELADRGMPIPVSWVRQEFRIPEPATGEKCLGEPPGTQASRKTPVARVAKASMHQGDPTPITRLADRMSTETSDSLESWLGIIRAMAEEAESLEDLRDMLLSAYGNLPADDLARVMQAGFAVADLAGRYDVKEVSS